MGRAALATRPADATLINTTCPYCGVGCGVEMQRNNQAWLCRGDQQHPANAGKLCVKGSALAETLDSRGRLLEPQINGVAVSIDQACTRIADEFKQVIAEHGPDAVAFYVSGQLLTEDYYVANKLIKGFMGTANIDTNSRLCMASAVVGYKRAFGADAVPCSYEDLALADLLVLVGSNAAWAHPILYQKMTQAKRDNPHKKVVVIDPRRTATCDLADLHLAIKPGTDALLFNGLLAYLAKQDCLDARFIIEHTEGFVLALAQAEATADTDLAVLAADCGVSESDLNKFFAWFAQTPRTVTFYSQGVNQSSSGVDKSNAIINVHLATGRIGKPGAGPFSITGQPNAMGGREVGGLANQLAAHMDFNDPAAIDRVERFWQAENMAQQNGLKAVDLFQAVDAGKVKAIWIMHTNPVVTMPDADFVRRALEKCACVVVSDAVADTDTTRCANILLPAAAWGEKDGTVTNSDRTISRQRAFLSAPGQAKPDWWWICQVAQKMGFEQAFNYVSPFGVFKEHVALSAFENDGLLSRRDFDLSGLQSLTEPEYQNLQPIQWPVTADYPNGLKRLFEDGQFFTPNRRAKFIAITPQLPKESPSNDYPFVLNTGRYRDQWHTMTRTAKTPKLLQHRDEPRLSMHPDDAQQCGLVTGDLAMVTSRLGKLILPVECDTGLVKGQVFVPMHWTGVYAKHGRVDRLIPAHTDPLSGQPESKHAVVNITAWPAAFRAGYWTKDFDWQPAENLGYWVKVPKENGVFWHLADTQGFDLSTWQSNQPQLNEPDLCFEDEALGVVRFAWLDLQDGLVAALFVAPNLRLQPPYDWVSSLLNQTLLNDSDRYGLLSGLAVDKVDAGATICSCFQVGEKTLCDAIKEGGATLDKLGEKTGAGTNCGSCIPELKALIAQGG
ncbi:nitrate reductase [Thiomicrospira cyclica]|uniref:Nitrate reductase n=1 Tax=Thiomicrospira cyclica (strain DSM 14477 / JCM 11371 / ALM1) TaxID=717773 RepID=F6DCH0_THICA|nr:nitrate reductase [Thiomicrospira cyclica]AEG31556.1 Nitrate reductase [Thiomicrospira cyclica ALM1]